MRNSKKKSGPQGSPSAWFTGLLAAGLTWGCDLPAPREVVPEPAPLVILISIDTLRADHLGAYGYERFTSPVLDGLAREGVLFEDASAPSPWTLPSHASMLSGLYPLRHGVLSPATALAPEIPTLASLLRSQGFETAAVVNSIWLQRDTFRLTRDFDEYLAVHNADYGRRTPSRWITDQAMEWIEQKRGQPFFLFMHYYDVHSDYASEAAYEKLFVEAYDGIADGTGWQLQRSNFADAHIEKCLRRFEPGVCAFGSIDKPRHIDASMERVHFDAEDVRHLEALYDAGIRQLDTELGRFFAFLRREGLMQEALLVVTSDHGEEFMEHGRVEHSLTTYQESLRVPLIIRGAGIPAGLRVATPVSLVDIVPTVLAHVDAHPGDLGAHPGDLDGVDLAATWGAADALPLSPRRLFGEATGGLQYEGELAGVYPVYRSIRDGRYKLIVETVAGTSALYDLESDPLEQVDIAAANPDVAARLAAELNERVSATEPAPASPAAELDPEQVEALRALGYVP